MAQHFKIEDALKPEHRQELLRLAMQPSSTIDSLHEQVQAWGYSIGRTAVGNWRSKVKVNVKTPADELAERIRSLGLNLKQETFAQIHALLEANEK